MNLLWAQPADPDEIRRVTEQVLSQADYQAAGGPSLLDQLINYLLEQVGRLLLRFDTGGGPGSIVAALVLIGAVVGLVIGVAVLIRRLRRSDTLPTVVTGPIGRDPVSWAAEAERHEREGNLRQALRCRYRETLARLAAANLIDEIPGRTTGEYLRAVRRAVPAAGDPFESFTRRFEETWYGGREVDAALLSDITGFQETVIHSALGRRRVGMS
ncbi:MAG: DUF4129 domain-containing protein [Euzebya sp.]